MAGRFISACRIREFKSRKKRIIVALLIYKFGKANVETEIPITEPEVDVK